MIRFPCRCGHTFEEPDDAAGAAVQCPRCMLLNDVPLHSDLNAIQRDGTYHVVPSEAPANPGSAEELVYIFAKTKVDDEGNPIDLRNADDDMSELGEPETIDGLQRRHRPRYDPETGELVQPIALAAAPSAPEPDPSEIPFAKPTLGYEVREALTPGTGNMLLELVRPHSIVVIFLVFGIHLITALTDAVTEMGLIFFAPALLGMVIVIFAHYGNVVNEVGVEERDELPRVLGDMRLYEDVWLPAVHATTALLLCFGPLAAMWFVSFPLTVLDSTVVAGLLFLVGTFMLPATLLTLLTSGTLSNLRPDRILSVIHRSLAHYARICALFLLGFSASVWAMFSLVMEAMTVCGLHSGVPHVLTQLPIALPLLLAGIFTLHYFCCQLGLYYRANHQRFPWAGQIHDVGSALADTSRRNHGA